jgi:hypothetical protein
MDGAGAVQQTTTNSGMPYRKSVSDLTNVPHSLVLNNQSATNALDLMGAITYADPTKGLLFSRLAFSGNSLGANYGYTGNGQLPDDRLKLFSGNTTAAGNEKSFGYPMQPALAIIEMSINDCQLGVSGDQYRNLLQRLCQALRAGYQDCTILFVICSNPDSVTSEVTNAFVNAQNYSLYTRVIYEVANMFNCGVYNEHALWAAHGVALGYQIALDPHGTTAGHANRATNIGALLGI